MSDSGGEGCRFFVARVGCRARRFAVQWGQNSLKMEEV